MPKDLSYTEKTDILRKEYEKANKDLDQLRFEKEEAIRVIEKTKIELNVLQKSISDLNEELVKLDALIASRLQLEKSLDEEYDRKLKEYTSKLVSLEESVKKTLEGVEERKNEIEQLIEKNGLVLKNIELDRNRLEIYVRRLDRYYKETGIQLRILPTFGFKEIE